MNQLRKYVDQFVVVHLEFIIFRYCRSVVNHQLNTNELHQAKSPTLLFNFGKAALKFFSFGLGRVESMYVTMYERELKC